jgi:hypothetical protein
LDKGHALRLAVIFHAGWAFWSDGFGVLVDALEKGWHGSFECICIFGFGLYDVVQMNEDSVHLCDVGHICAIFVLCL